jgi:phage shock protein C
MNKKLYRSRKDKMIAGVAGGLGEYFDVDVTLIRILLVVSLFFGGFGLLAYMILWIVVPEEPFVFHNEAGTDSSKPEEEDKLRDANERYNRAFEDQRNKRRNFAGVILIIIGVIFLADNYIPRIHFADFIPLIIIAIGVAVLVNVKR